MNSTTCTPSAKVYADLTSDMEGLQVIVYSTVTPLYGFLPAALLIEATQAHPRSPSSCP